MKKQYILFEEGSIKVVDNIDEEKLMLFDSNTNECKLYLMRCGDGILDYVNNPVICIDVVGDMSQNDIVILITSKLYSIIKTWYTNGYYNIHNDSLKIRIISGFVLLLCNFIHSTRCECSNVFTFKEMGIEMGINMKHTNKHVLKKFKDVVKHIDLQDPSITKDEHLKMRETNHMGQLISKTDKYWTFVGSLGVLDGTDGIPSAMIEFKHDITIYDALNMILDILNMLVYKKISETCRKNIPYPGAIMSSTPMLLDFIFNSILASLKTEVK